MKGRKPNNVIVLFLTLLVVGHCAWSQTMISGVVNKYIQVIDVIPCDSSVVVTNTAAFAPGDKVLMIQMKGAKIHTDNDSLFGRVIDIASAGCLEYLTIKSIQNDKFEFTNRFTNNYDVNGSVQLVRVARYDSVRVVGPVVAPKWNGTVGGVLVLEVTGNMYLFNNLLVDGSGFSGGSVSMNVSRCLQLDYISNWIEARSGGKGEGFASLNVNYPLAGRGPLANGGGGGNGCNAGGAGGSNGGLGGNGGDANYATGPYLTVGGRTAGKTANSILLQHLFMGGGGGGGHQNDAQGTAGANGGGIIAIRCGKIYGNGYRISACGAGVIDSAFWDGCGGGGAGGSILIETDSIATPVFLSAYGGKGGDNKQQYTGHGPGGGGGGGVIVLNKPHQLVNVELNGGINGTHTNPSNLDYLNPRNATPGEAGVFINNGWTWKTPYTIGLSVGGSAELCPGDSATLWASAGFKSYRWSNGDTTQNITVGAAGTYSVSTIDQGGCSYSSANLIVTIDPIKFSVTPMVDIGAVNLFTAGNGFFTITNEDDEPVEVASVTGLSEFVLLQPNQFPLTIPAGQSVNVDFTITPTDVKRFADTAHIAMSLPCPGSAMVELFAHVDTVIVQYNVPDTAGTTGQTGFSIPIRASIIPAEKVLPGTVARITLTVDSRLFAPTGAKNARIVGDLIDKIRNVRTITLETDPVDITGSNLVVAEFVGTLLIGVVQGSALNIESVEYIYVQQFPTNETKNGSIQTNDVCFNPARPIQFYSLSELTIQPNPASDVVTMNTVFSAPGAYEIKVVDMLGQTVFTQSYIHQGASGDVAKCVVVNVDTWGVGRYMTTFVSPLRTTTTGMEVVR